MGKVASFEELEKADDTTYDEVAALGLIIRIGSLSAADINEWVEANEDPQKKKEAGVRLAVKSIVNEDGARLPGCSDADFEEALFEAQVVTMRRKNASSVGKIVKAALALNGLRKKDDAPAAPKEEAKNGSGEALTVASPSA